MEKVNIREGINKLVVFSMDVSKMFPSLIASDVAKVVEVEVDDTELGLMLAILVSREEVEGAGLGEGVQEEEERSSDLDHHQVDHRRKRRTSRKSLS